jgi:hypothetical protein
MIIDKDKKIEFDAVVDPVIKWLNDNCHPHTSITIDSIRAELSEGVCVHHTTEHVKD